MTWAYLKAPTETELDEKREILLTHLQPFEQTYLQIATEILGFIPRNETKDSTT